MFYKQFPQENPSSLKYAVVIPRNDDSAPVGIALSIANAAHKHGFDVCVYWFTNVNNGQIRHDGVTRNYLELSKYNIIHSHLLRPDLFCFFLRIIFTLRRLCARAKPIFVSTVHSDFKYELSLDRNYFIALFASYAWLYATKHLDAVIFTSKTVQKTYFPNYDNSFVIHNGVDFEQINRSDKFIDDDIVAKINAFKQSDEILVGYIGGLRAIKGVNHLICALPKLPANYKLVILGAGSELSKLNELISDLNLTDRVLFLGRVDSPYFYAKLFELTLFPSLSEAFCLAAVEASYVAGNVIVSNIPTFIELLPDQIFPKFFSHDPECIGACISEHLNAIREKSGAQKNYVFSRYSSELMGDRYCNLFNSLHHGSVFYE